MPWLDDESSGSPGKSALRIIVRGRVQGVGFRWWTMSLAREYGVFGRVGNRPDGSVEILAEGPENILSLFISEVKEGPPMARIESVEVKPAVVQGFRDFSVTGY